jgi:hypothetical protein
MPDELTYPNDAPKRGWLVGEFTTGNFSRIPASPLFSVLPEINGSDTGANHVIYSRARI